MRDSILRADSDEAAENAASIELVPLHILPPGPARDALLWLAREGCDCYAYASGGELTGTWCAWLGDLADARRPERNGRVALAEEWVPNFRALLAEMGLMPDEEARR